MADIRRLKYMGIVISIGFMGCFFHAIGHVFVSIPLARTWTHIQTIYALILMIFEWFPTLLTSIVLFLRFEKPIKKEIEPDPEIYI
jgi:hypothetical protein